MADDLTTEELAKRGEWLREQALTVARELLDELARRLEAVPPPWGAHAPGGGKGHALMTVGAMLGAYLARHSSGNIPAPIIVEYIWRDLEGTVVEVVDLERKWLKT